MPSICCKAASSILLASDLLAGFGRVAGGAEADDVSATSMFTIASNRTPTTIDHWTRYWQMFAAQQDRVYVCLLPTQQENHLCDFYTIILLCMMRCWAHCLCKQSGGARSNRRQHNTKLYHTQNSIQYGRGRRHFLSFECLRFLSFKSLGSSVFCFLNINSYHFCRHFWNVGLRK